MKAIANKDGEFVIELLRSLGRAIKKCICLRRSIKLRRFRKHRKSGFHRARSTFQRVWNTGKRSRTTFLTVNLRSFRQFFCLKGEIQEMKRDLKFLEAQMKEIDVKLSREGKKPTEDVRIWKEEAEKIKKAVDDKFEMGKQNGYVGICPETWHRLKMNLKVDEYNLRINQLQNRHTKFEGKYGDDLIEVLARKGPELKAFELSEETVCSINNWENFCNGVEPFGDNSDLVHPLEKTPLFCLAFFLQFFTESETTIAALITICWLFVLTLFYVLSHQRKTRRELECSSTSSCHSRDEFPETASSNWTRYSEMMEREVGSSSSSQMKLDGKPQQEIVPIVD